MFQHRRFVDGGSAQEARYDSTHTGVRRVGKGRVDALGAGATNAWTLTSGCMDGARPTGVGCTGVGWTLIDALRCGLYGCGASYDIRDANSRYTRTAVARTAVCAISLDSFGLLSAVTAFDLYARVYVPRAAW